MKKCKLCKQEKELWSNEMCVECNIAIANEVLRLCNENLIKEGIIDGDKNVQEENKI
jgi:hypothetical protein